MISTVMPYTRDSECRDCGKPWTSTVHPATYHEPSDETEPDCPHCGGHDTECECEDCGPKGARQEATRDALEKALNAALADQAVLPMMSHQRHIALALLREMFGTAVAA